MKKLVLLFLLIPFTFLLQAQSAYDSITISRFLINEKMYWVNWQDTLKLGRFLAHIYEEKTVWVKPAKPQKVLPPVISISNRVKGNGTADVAKCFIPRHSINYYKGGKIIRYLLICFECDGVRFSDDPKKLFIKNIDTRDKQMLELKKLFKEFL
jgi:hypothetical protein